MIVPSLRAPDTIGGVAIPLLKDGADSRGFPRRPDSNWDSSE